MVSINTRVSFVLLLFVLLFLPCSVDSRALCMEEERDALLDFKLSFTADPYSSLSSWSINNTECCEWEGVECDNHTRHVVSVLLVDNDLVSSQLRPSLLRLHYLSFLDLGHNNFSMRIPQFIGSLTTLSYLYLDNSGFFGMIPPFLGNLTKLKEVYLSENYGLYANNFQWLSHLSALEELHLSYINLSMAAFEPFSSSLLNLNSLNLSGSLINKIPDLSKLSSLTYFDASGNNMSGYLYLLLQHLPTSISTLELSHNSLNGVISDAHFAKLPNLIVLDLSENYHLTFNFSESWVPPFNLESLSLRSCKLGPHFPNWILTQTTLNTLDISNSSISGVIPNSIWYTGAIWYLYLNVSHNKFQGTIPNLFIDFFIIDLSFNYFHGRIPTQLFFSRNANMLDFSNNKFSSFSSFPKKISSDSRIMHINLSNNLLLGSPPDWIFKFPSLVILNLANNMLSGTLSNNMASLWNLNTLHLNNNRFHGKLPSSMKNCTQLVILELQNNNFSGTLPFWIGDTLSQLIFLNFRSNNFSGDLPSNLCYLQKLQVLDLSSNRISGSIPGCVHNFTSMARYQSFQGSTLSYSDTPIGAFAASPIDGVGYLDYASIMWKGILANESSQNLPQWNVIDLSGNFLTGKIPSEVTSLKYLRSLDLSRNNLNGSIPNAIGQLKFMEVLWLSSNNLSGQIPKSLDELTFLNKLNLSSNNLSGRIPSSTQLQSFDPSSFSGNPNLCGDPLLIKCLGDNVIKKQPPSVEDHPENDANEPLDWEAFYAALGLGFALGLLGILGIMNFHAPSRHAFFRVSDQIGNWIFVYTSMCKSRIKRSL